MKIAYLFDTFPAASETFLEREITALRKRGFEIEVWALNAVDEAIAHQVAQANRFWKWSPEIFWRATGFNWARQLQNRGVNHLHAAWANHPALIAMSAAHAMGLSWSFAAHARDLWVDGGDLARKLESARFAVACTRAGASELQKHGSNAHYLPHGLQLENYPFQVWRAPEAPKLLGVGRLVEKKGWKWALSAAQELRMPLELIGDGPLRESLSQNFKQKLETPVHWRGELAQKEVIAAMQNATCLVLPSIVTRDGDRDGLANVLLEAAALGTPLVTTRAGSAEDLVDDDTGWLCTPETLAVTIRRLLREEDETRRRCLNARKRVEERFDIASNAALLARAFEGANT